jgi:hypothetical protein
MGPATPNHHHADLLSHCLQEAERRVPELTRRCIEAMLSSLQAAEGASLHNRQRQLFARATISLAQNRMVLIQTYPRRLSEGFDNRASEPGMSGLAELSDSSMLQLVDDAAVNESLESVRLLQNLLPLVEHALPILDARMSSLIGLDTVAVEKNPLRPSVFARELRDLMAEVEPDGDVRSLWMQHIAHVLGRELGQLYEQLALMLQQANVQEASYRIRLVEDPEASRAAAASASVANVPDLLAEQGIGRGASWEDARVALPAMPLLAKSRSEVESGVFQAFLGRREPVFDQPLDSAYYDELQREHAAVDAQAALPVPDSAALAQSLQALRGLPVVERPSLPVSVNSALNADDWGRFGLAHERTRVLLELKQRAQRASQAIGLDLVRKLVNQVARDPLLLSPVREAVVALEPALLCLALTEPRYFAEADHPARRLVEEVAQRSFRFNDEFAAEFQAFMGPVREAFNRLNAGRSDDPQPFSLALQGLKSGWAAADQAEQAARDEKLGALRLAETRQELADQIAWEISLRPDVFNAPELVLNFLYETWSLVIASSQLQGAGAEAQTQAWRTVVGTLLWSVREETLRQPKEVFERIPGLVKALHEGLAMLGKPQQESQAFFDALMRLHSPLLKLRRARARHDARQSDFTPLDMGEKLEPVKRVVTAVQRPFVTAQPWMAAQEWVNAGFEDTRPTSHESDFSLEPDMLEPEVAADPPEKAPLSDAQSPVVQRQDAELLLGRLREGARVDLFSQGEWLRAELVWASARGALFLFTSPGGRSHTMTRRSCERLIRQRWLRPVESHVVVDDALKAVLQPALTTQEPDWADTESEALG